MMAYSPNLIWTLGDTETVQAMAAKGQPAGEIARVVTARMTVRHDPHRRKLSAADVIKFCDDNNIFVRTKEVAQ